MVGDVEEGVWRIFGEGSEVRLCEEVVKNGGRKRERRAATGRQGSATGCPRAELVTFWGEMEGKEGKN